MNSLFAFDALSAIRVKVLVDEAIQQATAELRYAEDTHTNLLNNPPKRLPGFKNFWRWLLATDNRESNSSEVCYQLKYFCIGYNKDITKLSSVNAALLFKPQHVAVDQITMDLINKYTNQTLIEERKQRLANLLNIIK